MAIPESQLETWSHQGSVAQSSGTYATVKRALEAGSAGYSGKECEVFLQGSYGNDTNIYGESDVDVVIRLDSCFYHDLRELPEQQQQAFRTVMSDSSYNYSDYKNHVEQALRNAFGNSAKPGTRAIKIAANGARRSADVVAAMQFRRYYRFNSIADQNYEEGICFFTSGWERISNYPKQHSANLTAKHQATGGMFKPLVRILKNTRGRLVENGVIEKDLAPSYFIEGLLYNVPNENFSGDHEDAFVNSINWLIKTDRSKFVCANEQYYLLRDTSVTWSEVKCKQFLDAIAKLWKSW